MNSSTRCDRCEMNKRKTCTVMIIRYMYDGTLGSCSCMVNVGRTGNFSHQNYMEETIYENTESDPCYSPSVSSPSDYAHLEMIDVCTSEYLVSRMESAITSTLFNLYSWVCLFVGEQDEASSVS